jgi:hypothetical protein
MMSPAAARRGLGATKRFSQTIKQTCLWRLFTITALAAEEQCLAANAVSR